MRRWLAFIALLSATACAAPAPSQALAQRLDRLERQARARVVQVERALDDPQLTFRSLGESLRALEATTSALGRIEDDAGLEPEVRMEAALLTARAWDDVARAFSTPPRAAAPEVAAVVAQVLRDKQLPARVAARAAYGRAHDFACQADLPGQASGAPDGASADRLAEIRDGLTRSGAGRPSCP